VGGRRTDFSPHAAADGRVTLIFSDIEAFTRMTERLGDARAHAVVKRHNDIVRAETRKQGGHEVELRGDGFLLAFGDATAALRCAIAIQRSLAAHNASGPVEPLRVRIGLHTGHVIQDSDKFFGKTVIQAFRVADLAEGTQILISKDLKTALAPATDFRIGEGRAVTLKGISGTHQVYAVEWS
jgi:class 3 adenylate cyclase